MNDGRSGQRAGRRTARAVAVLSAVLFLTACGASRGATETVHGDGGAIIVQGAALFDGHGSVLDAIRGKVPSLRVRRDGGPCPRITLRDDSSFMTQTNPLVYLDGNRTNDTCVLESIRSRDIQQVEVYPRGVTTRPGYDMHAHGLILLFTAS